MRFFAGTSVVSLIAAVALAAGSAGPASAGPASAGPASAGPASAGPGHPASHASATQQAYAAGVEAYIHGYPPLLSAASQTTFLTNALAGVAAPSSPDNRLVVLPNVDTAYMVARLDLRNGPVIVRVPSMPGRYYTLQLIDAYTNVFGYIGTRVTGSGARDYAIAGPGTPGDVPGYTTIHSPTPDALLLGRALIHRSDTPATLHALLAPFAMAPLSALAAGGAPAPIIVLDAAPKSTPAEVPHGVAFLDALDRLLSADPPSAAERAALAPLKRYGIGPGRERAITTLPPAVRRALIRGVAAGPAQLDDRVQRFERASARRHNGWVLTGLHTGATGDDWSLRAIVAKLELFANTPAEAIYPIASEDSAGRPLTGRHRYGLTFRRRPPARAFWSVTMYRSDGRLYANPLKRYGLGDRSPGLVSAHGGPVTITMQHRAPASDRPAWLPAPAGRFTVALRLYLPAAAARRARWSPPGVTCLDCRPSHRRAHTAR